MGAIWGAETNAEESLMSCKVILVLLTTISDFLPDHPRGGLSTGPRRSLRGDIGGV